MSNEYAKLSESTYRELSAERDRLRSVRDHHASELKSTDNLLIHIEAILSTANGTTPATIIVASAQQIGTLREAIMAIMEKHQQGIKPGDVTRILEEERYAHKGSTSLALAVSNTMWRMKRAGDAQQSKKTGKYRLIREDETQAAGE